MRATGPGQPGHLLLDVIDILNELRIPYAVVGAFAVSFYGVPRSTRDADAIVWLGDTTTGLLHIASRSQAAGYRADVKRGETDDPVAGAIIIKDAHENQVDLLLGIRGMDPDAASRCVSESLLDSSVRIIAAEDLIPMKIFAGGPQDIQDVRGMLQVSGASLNLDLLRGLARRYGSDAARTLEELIRESAPTTH
jgi:hypothetical protein